MGLENRQLARALLARVPSGRKLLDGTDESAFNELVLEDGGPLSSGERVLFLVAAEVLGYTTRLTFADLFRLDDDNLLLVTRVLRALATQDSLDLEAAELAGRDAPRPRATAARRQKGGE